MHALWMRQSDDVGRSKPFYIDDRSEGGGAMSATDIIASCQRQLPAYPNDCSGFAKAVAHDCGVLLAGDANRIVFLLSTGMPMASGRDARAAAASGLLVLAGLEGRGHGHVVVIVDGPLNRDGHPYAFWGQYHGIRANGVELNVGFTRGHGTLNWAFKKNDLGRVRMAAFRPVDTLMIRAGEGEGRLLYTFV
jgi:hypothetical protein